MFFTAACPSVLPIIPSYVIFPCLYCKSFNKKHLFDVSLCPFVLVSLYLIYPCPQLKSKRCRCICIRESIVLTANCQTEMKCTVSHGTQTTLNSIVSVSTAAPLLCHKRIKALKVKHIKIGLLCNLLALYETKLYPRCRNNECL